MWQQIGIYITTKLSNCLYLPEARHAGDVKVSSNIFDSNIQITFAMVTEKNVHPYVSTTHISVTQCMQIQREMSRQERDPLLRPNYTMSLKGDRVSYGIQILLNWSLGCIAGVNRIVACKDSQKQLKNPCFIGSRSLDFLGLSVLTHAP